MGAFIRKLRASTSCRRSSNVLRGAHELRRAASGAAGVRAELSQKIPYYVERTCVKPGITGWAQLCYPYGSSEQDALEKLQYDLYYIKNNSFVRSAILCRR